MSENEILFLDVPFEIVGIEGIWDLTMLGPERRNIEYRYMLTYRRRFTGNRLHSIFVKRPNGWWSQLWEQRPAGDVPALALPDDHVLVVRTAVLDELIRQMSAPQKQEPQSEQPTKSHAVDAAASSGLTHEAFDIAAQDLETKEGRREAVDAFLAYANRSQRHTVKQHHIWKAMGYTTARPFQYWLEMKGPPKETVACDQNARRVLAMATSYFLDLLRRKGQI